jgi:hypothetical protein
MLAEDGAMKGFGWLAIAALLGVLVCAPARAEEASVLLEAGVYAEEVVGDLDKAVETYRQIIAEAGADSRCVAEAHCRLGSCLLKKGDEKAAFEQFRTVLDDYSGQGAVAAKTVQAWAQAVRSRSRVPVVLYTSPAALAGDVSPSLGEITVVFDRPMMDGSWSWTGGGETYPQTPGNPHYDATRMICTLPVKLEPGKVYWVGVNSPSNHYFQTQDHLSAPWFVVLFATNDAAGNPTPIPADLREKAEAINGAQTLGPPQVLGVSPNVFAEDVSPTLDRITVTFDQPMMDRSWSWTGSGDTYPQTLGEPYYDATRTICTLPVKLAPGKVYWVGVNSASHHYFQTPSHVPARWFVVLFATRDAAGNPTPIPEDLRQKAEAINAAHTLGPPQVLHVSPQVFAGDVSPAVNRITVTFDQPMMDQSWSWTGGGETFPQVTGNPHYDAERKVCTLPVKLAPAKVYWIGVNSVSFKNFQTPGHVPAQQFVLLFATADAAGNPTPIPEDMRQQAEAINGLAP